MVENTDLGVPYPAALTLGAVSGMRSMMAPAVISWAAKRSGLDLESVPFSSFKGANVGKTAVTMALGELLSDSTHYAPSRLDSATMLGRAVSGGAAGAAIFRARKGNLIIGALLGATAAVGAAYASHYLRKKAATYFNLTDRTVALAEDGIALGAGLIAVAITKNGAKPPVDI